MTFRPLASVAIIAVGAVTILALAMVPGQCGSPGSDPDRGRNAEKVPTDQGSDGTTPPSRWTPRPPRQPTLQTRPHVGSPPERTDAARSVRIEILDPPSGRSNSAERTTRSGTLWLWRPRQGGAPLAVEIVAGLGSCRMPYWGTSARATFVEQASASATVCLLVESNGDVWRFARDCDVYRPSTLGGLYRGALHVDAVSPTFRPRRVRRPLARPLT